MSLIEYYKSPVVWKSAEVATVGTTTTVWTPTSGTRVVLDSAIISVYGPNTTTVSLIFGADSLAVVPNRIAVINLSASASVNLKFPGVTNGIIDQVVRVTTAAAPVSVNLYGFEI